VNAEPAGPGGFAPEPKRSAGTRNSSSTSGAYASLTTANAVASSASGTRRGGEPVSEVASRTTHAVQSSARPLVTPSTASVEATNTESGASASAAKASR